MKAGQLVTAIRKVKGKLWACVNGTDDTMYFIIEKQYAIQKFSHWNSNVETGYILYQNDNGDWILGAGE